MDFLHEMLSKRCSWLSKSWLVFPLSKSSSDGQTTEIVDGCLVSMITDNEEKEINIKIGKINCCSNLYHTFHVDVNPIYYFEKDFII